MCEDDFYPRSILSDANIASFLLVAIDLLVFFLAVFVFLCFRPFP